VVHLGDEGLLVAAWASTLRMTFPGDLSDFGRVDRHGPCGEYEQVWVWGNAQLSALQLSPLSSPCLRVSDNPALMRIAADELHGASLRLSDLPSLSQLDFAFVNLDKLSISRTGLTSLAGLSFGAVTCELTLTDNPELVDLGPLQQYPGEVARTLALTGNPKLSACSVAALVATLHEPTTVCINADRMAQPAHRLVVVESNDEAAVCQ
jgi:hypothetical protein